VGSLARGRRNKLVHACEALRFEGLVFQETGVAERIEEMLFEFPDLDFARDPNQVRPQIQTGVLAIEARQALHQLRRDEQHGIGKLQRIANQKAGMLGIVGGKEIES
jgi:hypothetical protein